MSEMIPMTRTGYDKIKAELDHLEHVEMPAIMTRVAHARSEGDLSENAEYHRKACCKPRSTCCATSCRARRWSTHPSYPRTKSCSAPPWW
jgi:hypothetical protein